MSLFIMQREKQQMKFKDEIGTLKIKTQKNAALQIQQVEIGHVENTLVFAGTQK